MCKSCVDTCVNVFLLLQGMLVEGPPGPEGPTVRLNVNSMRVLYELVFEKLFKTINVFWKTVHNVKLGKRHLSCSLLKDWIFE